MVLDMKAEPKDGGKIENATHNNDFNERQSLFSRPEIEDAISSHQFTTAGVVSTKYRRLEDDLANNTSPPNSYVSNTNKELLCLEYVRGFQRQFEQLFPKRNPLFLFPPNEKGIAKFVCTTIRPTLLPYRDLYEYAPLARFIAGIIEYEPLTDPLGPPHVLPSPFFTLNWKAGDCFDMSLVLVSFLIGAGYDAYVVKGTAPRWITLHDQSRTPCPPIFVEEQNIKSKEKEFNSNNIVENTNTSSTHKEEIHLESRSSFKSKYVQAQEEEQKKKKEQEQNHQNKGILANCFYNEDEEDDDPLEGKRVHAWVLVRAGKREVAEHFFIEPSTGQIFSLQEAPYLLIESVWNNENYWVNMQLDQQPVATTLYDLSNPTDWEYVFLSASERKTTKENVNDTKKNHSMDLKDDLALKSDTENTMNPNSKNNNNNYNNSNSQQHQDEEEKEEEEEEEEEESNDLILDIPPSWVEKLFIERSVYKQKFVRDAHRVIRFCRAKMEEFAENTHEQGLIKRVTLYRDNTCILPVEIYEFFTNRKDKLEIRKRFPLEGRFEEMFGPGRLPEALKKRIEYIGFKRELHFYTSARNDGLVKREEIIQKRINEFYEARDDFLIYRSVSIAGDKDEIDSRIPYVLPGGPTGELAIRKMVEKFSHNPFVIADEDPRKKTYNVQEGNIRVNFHFAEGKITAGSRTYYKAPNVPIEVILSDPNGKKPKKSILDDELCAFFQMEKDCYTAVRHSEIETQDILKNRKREESTIILETNLFEDATNDQNTKKKKKEEEKNNEKDTKTEIDYLSPFLQAIHYTGAGELSKEDAHTVRDMCLRNLKERLLERANIIQARLDKENALLAKRQAAFQRSQREHDQGTDDEFERFCSDTMFRIQILEQRLASHEETALQKYVEMDQRLHSDPRLKILHKSN